MARRFAMSLLAALCLSACAPQTAATPSSVAEPAQATPPAAPPAATEATPAPTAAQSPKPQAAGATIRGAIRDGNRLPPALRICAHPVDGGAPTCTDSAAGATDYRLDVAPGRYVVMGWVRAGDPKLIAHATQIRCIRAPCPPDELIEVEVVAGEEKAGVDLSGSYVDVPQGWPGRP